MTFSEKLKQAMDDLNLTQADVAVKTGKSKASICQYTSGNTVPPERTQEKIAVLLGLPATYFSDEKVIDFSNLTGKNMLPEQAARILGVNPATIRKGLQQGVFPWGYAVKTTEDRWTYIINTKKFFEIERVEDGTKRAL